MVIGALIGLQRQYDVAGKEKVRAAGARTFALMALAGCAAALAGDELQEPLVFAAIFLMVVGLVIAAYVSDGGGGMTTEVAAILTILCGALAYWGYLTLAGALGVTIAVLLTVKGQIQDFVERLTPEDVRASLTFAVITIIVLPILPDEPIGPEPFDAINPYDVWLMVVFVSGISFLGYVLNKFFGAERGIALAGLLGGVVSSTATSLSFADKSKQNERLIPAFGLAIILAWATVFIRVMVLIAVVNMTLFEEIWIPLTIATVAAGIYSYYRYRTHDDVDEDDIEFDNPFKLTSALRFGAIYGGILLFSRVAVLYLGDAGVYLSSAISGSVSMSAVALSTADLYGRNAIDATAAVQSILIGLSTNILMNAGLTVTNGAERLRRPIAIGAVVFWLAIGLSFIYLQVI
jgi:uncharacterized membrane protein (DUF4010 family)